LKGSKGNHVDRLGFKGSTNGLGRGRGGRKGGLGKKGSKNGLESSNTAEDWLRKGILHEPAEEAAV